MCVCVCVCVYVCIRECVHTSFLFFVVSIYLSVCLPYIWQEARGKHPLPPPSTTGLRPSRRPVRLRADSRPHAPTARSRRAPVSQSHGAAEANASRPRAAQCGWTLWMLKFSADLRSVPPPPSPPAPHVERREPGSGSKRR